MGKGSQEPTFVPAQPAQSMPDIEAIMMPMMQMMEYTQSVSQQMMRQSNEMMQSALSSPPPIEEPKPIDWAAENAALQEKISKDMTAEAERRRGRSSTVLTSSALEDEEPKLVKSVLEGS